MENPNYEYNKKIYRVFKTTLEMLEDRGYAIPEELKKKTFKQFIE